VILAPVNDVECLAQLTTIARELASTTLVETVARHLGSREAVIRWLQAKPQADDDGREAVRYITCDVPQRVRLLADDPNCVERATDALLLLESLERMKLIEPAARALATVDRPARHTGLVEKHGAHWYAVDLFPRRNASSRNADWKDVLQGVHSYVGKPILQFYGLGSVADTVGENENKLLGRDKKETKNEKKQLPSAGPAPKGQPKKEPQPSGGKKQQSGAQLVSLAGGVLRSGATSQGGSDAKAETGKPALRAVAAGTGAAAGGDGAAPGRGAVEEEAQRVRWWGLE